MRRSALAFSLEIILATPASPVTHGRDDGQLDVLLSLLRWLHLDQSLPGGGQPADQA